MAKLLVFKNIKSKDTWTHYPNDNVLLYCNFNSSLHPSLLKIGQRMIVKDANGSPVLIECINDNLITNKGKKYG